MTRFRLASLAALLLLATAPARAATYLLVCGPASCHAADGTTQPAGTALGRIVWDGHAPYAAPAGEQVVPDDARAVYQPARRRGASTIITASAFLARFSPAEQAAVQQAAAAQPATIGVGLTTGLAAGTINLTGCAAACADPKLRPWMDSLVAAGAITAARETEILTP